MSESSSCHSSSSLSGFLNCTTLELKRRASSIDDTELVLRASDRLKRTLAHIEAACLAEAERSGAVKRSGARSPADWMAGVTGESKQAAIGKARTAEAIAAHPELGTALLDGSVNAEQAGIVADTAKNTNATPAQVAGLLEEVKDSDVASTRRAARRLAREIADETPGERFAQQRRKRRCSIKDSADHEGMIELRALLDPLAGAQLKHRLFSVAKAMGNDPENKATFSQRLADALVQECTRENGSRHGSSGHGTRRGAGRASGRASVVVTITLDDLMGHAAQHNGSRAKTDQPEPDTSGAGNTEAARAERAETDEAAVGRIVGGDTIPAAEVEKLACENGIMPLVVDGPQQILDLGKPQPFAMGDLKVREPGTNGENKAAGARNSQHSGSGGDLRRQAAAQGLIPLLFGGPSEPLDLGYNRAFASGAQRAALLAVYGTCVIPGCDEDATMIEIHHVKYRRNGGKTDLTNLVPVCLGHHHLIHDERLKIFRNKDGAINITTRNGTPYEPPHQAPIKPPIKPP